MLTERINVLVKLGEYLQSNELEWQAIKDLAVQHNGWFTQEHIDFSIKNIVEGFLKKDQLEKWIAHYSTTTSPKKIGIIMAGNIPLVGFHDWLCTFISGHIAVVKTASKDAVLLPFLLNKIQTWNAQLGAQTIVAERLNHCDAYIATGSNNTSRYFEEYFGKYPHIIRRNRTSVALLTGLETTEELKLLAQDIFLYFGLGCRNITQIIVPQNYSFSPLLEVLDLYKDAMNHTKYHHNFEYHLAIFLLNKIPVLTNDSILIVENKIPFSAVSVLHYNYYDDYEKVLSALKNNTDIQCVVGKNGIPFGKAQQPHLMDYADGIDTMKFLSDL